MCLGNTQVYWCSFEVCKHYSVKDWFIRGTRHILKAFCHTATYLVASGFDFITILRELTILQEKNVRLLHYYFLVLSGSAIQLKCKPVN